MKIALTIPSFVPHGGTRIIIEWAVRLAYQHEVVLYCQNHHPIDVNWLHLPSHIAVIHDVRQLGRIDRLVICSPHDIDLENHPMLLSTPKILFLQMLEHLFDQSRTEWLMKCHAMYGSKNKMVLISKWNRDFIEKHYPARGPIHYVGNGVNFKDFPVEPYSDDKKTVLVEGWNSLNPSKDVNNIGPKVAAQLKAKGYRILAYSQKPPKIHKGVPHEFYVRPSLSQLNTLYREASILLKASRYDARACAPVEAMTKGTPTVRAITQGDDDLIHEENCLRCEYDEHALLNGALHLLGEPVLRNRLSRNCINYVQKYSWDYWFPKIEEVVTC